MENQKSIRSMRGPIADKIIRSAAKHAKNKIIDLSAWRSAKSYHERLQEFHLEKDLSHLNPLHAIYIDAQHRIVDFVEQFSSLPESRKLNKNYEKAEDTYMPSSPPMSPLTKSYFWAWASFDMPVGIKRETYATIMIDCCKALGANSEFIKILENMQQSRMGLYIHEGSDKKFVYLRELYTNEIVKAHVACEYFGAVGEIWFARILPDPLNHFDYSVVFTTPYIIIDCPLGKEVKGDFRKLKYLEKEWVEFIERNLSRDKYKGMQNAYYHFMKYGLNQLYWPEYIFQAYVNFQPNAIWLTGFPDKPESLPHADAGYANLLEE